MIPEADRLPIQNTWSIFASANAAQRRIILQGLLSACCTSQLSFIANTIEPLLRIDFTYILPPEICIQIFSYLDAQTLCAACQVSKRWKALADDDILWHRMCVQHIDKKCKKCGWGLPLLQKRRVVRLKKRTIDQVEDSGLIPAPKRADRKPWKRVYSERLIVERNWRKGRCNIRKFKQDSGILCVQVCDAQNILITGAQDKTATVWDLETGEVLRKMTGHIRCVSTLQFDDTKLVTGSMDHTLKIWNYHTGQCIRTLEGHTGGIVHLNFNSRILASASTDTTIKIWNFQTGQCYTLTGHTDIVNHTHIFDQHQLISSSSDMTIRQWDLDKRSCVRVFRGHMAGVQVAIPSMPGFVHRFIEDSCNSDDSCGSSAPVLVSGANDNTIKVWSMQEGKCIRTLFGHTRGVRTLAYDKLRLVSGSLDGSLKLWDIENGLPMHTLQDGSGSAITSVALTDSKVISVSDNGEIRVWDFGA